MKKKLSMLTVVLILFVLATIIFFFLFKKDTANTWQTYTNTRYNFSVDYPADWSLGEISENNDGREITSPDGKVTCRAYAFANALQNEQGDPQTLDEFINWLYDDPEYLLESSEATMANHDAYETLSQDEAGPYRQSTYVIEPDTGYGFYCLYADLDLKEENKDNYQLLVDSFSIQNDL